MAGGGSGRESEGAAGSLCEPRRGFLGGWAGLALSGVVVRRRGCLHPLNSVTEGRLAAEGGNLISLIPVARISLTTPRP